MTKTRFFAPLAAVALLATGAAPAFATAQDSGGSVSASSEKEARKTCKRFDHSASRLLSEKLCYTKADWKKFNSTN